MLFLFAFSLLLAQDVLNNESVIKLVKSGMSEELILNIIRQQPAAYSLGADQLIELRTAGVTEKVISAMLAKSSGKDPASSAASAPTAAKSLPTDPGVYYKKTSEWLETIAETVDWKSTGAMKNFVSAGIVKKDLKGSLQGLNSRNLVTSTTEIVIVPPSGVPISEFLLIPMKPNKGRREFEVGPPQKNASLARGAIAFGLEKIGPNHFRVAPVSPLSPGEYGVLPLSQVGSGTGMSNLYTFRLMP